MCCTLAHPCSDGTHALIFGPLEFLEKLAALIPRPRINLLLHGLLAPHARGCASAVATAVPRDEADGTPAPPSASTAGVPGTAPPPRRYFAWAELLRRVFVPPITSRTTLPRPGPNLGDWLLVAIAAAVMLSYMALWVSGIGRIVPR